MKQTHRGKKVDRGVGGRKTVRGPKRRKGSGEESHVKRTRGQG